MSPGVSRGGIAWTFLFVRVQVTRSCIHSASVFASQQREAWTFLLSGPDIFHKENMNHEHEL